MNEKRPTPSSKGPAEEFVASLCICFWARNSATNRRSTYDIKGKARVRERVCVCVVKEVTRGAPLFSHLCYNEGESKWYAMPKGSIWWF